MLTMSQINHIKDLSSCGYRISEISEKTGSDPKTNTSHRMISPLFHRLHRRILQNLIHLSLSFRSGWKKIKNTGQTAPHSTAHL